MSERYLRRFDGLDLFLHSLMMVTFLGLALTGLPLVFSAHPWAAALAGAFGSFTMAALLHRIFAAGLILCFLLHLGRLGRRLLRRDWGILWGPHSMIPQPKDLRDLLGHVRWFFGLGPRPRFDRFTYWEKFDYWAVFWGMGIIGGSGLVLWFPRFFARVIPGSLFNVAQLVHGEEALLAVGFIFTVHFFNGHLRPEKFPMDTVIFTGVVPAEEIEHERPAEYERIRATGEIERLNAPPPTAQRVSQGKFWGGLAVAVGLVVVALILYTAIR